MQYFSFTRQQPSVLLIARILLMLLFVIFGYQKLIHFGGTVDYMKALGTPLPTVGALIAVVLEFFAGLAIMLGFFTRPIAIIMAIYTLATAIIGHPFWSISGAAQMAAEINFYKNISIIGGLLLLSVTGAGPYSLDKK
ncbi:DoxX family protein [Rosenbergiella epipactidis]|uniref:DoxX family protein n=1 Tax=Rosenbergiella epipactidis TaxID=1544694 RepID=UPI000789DAA4|nr:DoxX family protein [Rosenbergiella epipactidis]KYP94055.1 membrane protein [bacteria symbiont BFo2 of Frankliniella occidentalis]KYP94105.1 membrane protein [bacteria symbiont BFo2 of Frankliniella occidentalis]